MRKILVIPGAFMPANDTVTFLSYKHLRLVDAQMDVMALKAPVDEGLMAKMKQDGFLHKFNITYVKDYDDTVATFERKNIVSGFLNILKYCYACYQKAKENDYAIVYTSSVPAFTHLAGYFIKRFLKKDIVWIASFSDPLYKSPYKKDKDSFKAYSLLEKIGFYVYIWIYMNGFYEKLAMKYADKILYICDEQKDFMIQNYKDKDTLEEKAMVIPLSYIQGWDYVVGEKHPDGPYTIAHFGRIYGLRKIDVLLEALKEMKKENANLSNQLQIHQYGQILLRYQTYIKDNDLEDVFVCHEKVPYEMMLEKMTSCNCLALLDTIVEAHQLQPYLPSKCVEYLLQRKPLFILTVQNSPSYRIFTEFGYDCTLYDKKAIINRLKHIQEEQKDYTQMDLSVFENEVATKPLVTFIQEKLKGEA